jgi:hypothetical protein
VCIALTKPVKPFKAGWIWIRPDPGMEKVKLSICIQVPEQYFNKYSKEYGSSMELTSLLYGQKRTVP